MRCAAIMNTQPATISADATIADAAEKLVSGRDTTLAVIDAQGRYAGIFGIDDLLGLIVPRVALAGGLAPNVRFIDDNPAQWQERFRGAGARRVGDAADRNALVLEPATPLAEAFRILCGLRVSLPVVEDGRLVGSLSYREIVAAIAAGR